MTKYISMVVLMLAISVGTGVYGQESGDGTKTVTLEARDNAKAGGPEDNYINATYSFKHGANGEEGLKLTRNNWDIQYSSLRQRDGKTIADLFHVTMVTDDRSRIKDLGKLEWKDKFSVPALPAYDKPTRHPHIEAKLGHIYLVHTADSELDHYALFRVESIDNGKTVTISWKLIPEPAEARPAK